MFCFIVRIIISLEVLTDFKYDLKYFHRVQAFIYQLLRKTEYDFLHDYRGYKFFCFSNIFPIGDFQEGDIRYLLLSSPDKKFIRLLKNKISSLSRRGEIVRFGDMVFKAKNVKAFNTRVGSYARIISSTPIVVRIPEKYYNIFNITSSKSEYIYWRSMYPVEAFIYMVKNNLSKKFELFYGYKPTLSEMFQDMKFKKEVALLLNIDGVDYNVVGSIWEFYYGYIDNSLRKFLKFSVDTGFGERNSYGFGFMNILK